MRDHEKAIAGEVASGWAAKLFAAWRLSLLVQLMVDLKPGGDIGPSLVPFALLASLGEFFHAAEDGLLYLYRLRYAVEGE